MRFDTDDSILMRRHIKQSLEPIRGHTEWREHAPEEKPNPLINLVMIGLGILIVGAMIAAVLPHQ